MYNNIIWYYVTQKGFTNTIIPTHVMLYSIRGGICYQPGTWCII